MPFDGAPERWEETPEPGHAPKIPGLQPWPNMIWWTFWLPIIVWGEFWLIRP